MDNPLVDRLYQTYLGRSPDAAGGAWWHQQLAGGMTPQQAEARIADSPEAQIAGSYQSILGRAPDPAGMRHYMDGYDTMGAHGVRQGMLRSPEYQTRMLGDWDVYRDAARQASAGVNNMPYVFSDYGSPATSPNPNMAGAIFPERSSGGSTLAQLLGLLDFRQPTPAPELPKPPEQPKPTTDTGQKSAMDQFTAYLDKRFPWMEK